MQIFILTACILIEALLFFICTHYIDTFLSHFKNYSRNLFDLDHASESCKWIRYVHLARQT